MFEQQMFEQRVIVTETSYASTYDFAILSVESFETAYDPLA